ncbi:MAG: hypothetical protein FWC85_04915, partial [Elusimicrobia bacterium]|nr:hypothetical protein [Elusimicrobiota bacterium]
MSDILVVNAADFSKIESLKSGKLVSKPEVFQIKDFNLDDFKKTVTQNNFSRAVFAYFSPHKDIHFLRALKSLGLNTEIVLFCPDLSSLAEYDHLNLQITDDYFYAATLNKNLATSAFDSSGAVIVENETDLSLVKKYCPEVNAVLVKDAEAKSVKFEPKKPYTVSVIMLTFNQFDDTKKCV